MLFGFLFLIDLYWSIIASQYCVSFCCPTKWISHMHTYVPISPSFWASLPSSLSHPRRSSQSTELISLCYAAASHQPTILHPVVCICWCYSHFAPALPSHPISSSPFSRSISLFLPCNQVHQYHFSVVRTLHSHCQGPGFDPWWGNKDPTCGTVQPNKQTNQQPKNPTVN